MATPAKSASTPQAHCWVDATLAPGARVELPPELAHHLGRVLRLQDGDSVTLFDGRDPVWLATVRFGGKHTAWADVLQLLPEQRESPLQVTLGQGLSTGDRMDMTIQKSVELGVAAIAPLATARAVLKLADERAEKRRQHWQRVAIAACEQSKRQRVPSVWAVEGLEHWLAGLPANAPKWFLCAHQGQRIADLPRPAAGSMGYLLAGPEGGFTERERASIVAAGFAPVRLGPRVLRTESAAMAALAAMLTLWGDF